VGGVRDVHGGMGGGWGGIWRDVLYECCMKMIDDCIVYVEMRGCICGGCWRGGIYVRYVMSVDGGGWVGIVGGAVGICRHWGNTRSCSFATSHTFNRCCMRMFQADC